MTPEELAELGAEQNGATIQWNGYDWDPQIFKNLIPDIKRGQAFAKKDSHWKWNRRQKEESK
jgi:hypothetical protein